MMVMEDLPMLVTDHDYIRYLFLSAQNGEQYWYLWSVVVVLNSETLFYYGSIVTWYKDIVNWKIASVEQDYFIIGWVTIKDIYSPYCCHSSHNSTL